MGVRTEFGIKNCGGECYVAYPYRLQSMDQVLTVGRGVMNPKSEQEFGEKFGWNDVAESRAKVNGWECYHWCLCYPDVSWKSIGSGAWSPPATVGGELQWIWEARVDVCCNKPQST